MQPKHSTANDIFPMQHLSFRWLIAMPQPANADTFTTMIEERQMIDGTLIPRASEEEEEATPEALRKSSEKPVNGALTSPTSFSDNKKRPQIKSAAFLVPALC
jgi:hypothetical protein